MAIQTQTVEYKDGDVVLEGYFAWDDTNSDRRPGVLIAHAWAGRSEFEEGKAESLAELGYAGFALDLYGKGMRGSNAEENTALMQPLLDDRKTLQRRMTLALEQIRKQEIVDDSRVAAMGFCFGGLSVLDLARTGAELSGVASFHGLFNPPGNTAGNKINAKVLVMHGWDDPMAKPDQVLTLADELTAMGADWQIHGYGNTMHAFTNPAANDPGFGTVYNERADRRSWQSLQLFLAEIF
ncbi:MAG: carboxymethylenebutenolidase [Gammaproteobacteria bacterium]|nr:MAG: carboxymethylenebutenolidase [Gammaproteobacteria bacterium]RLA29435.1 MAG: carboxymethylenebutenolidase [Gammaproteobacteria bacterium]